MSILLSAYELNMSFGSRVLFEDLTLTVATGERIGLIGPNGAGKSTLLKIIASKILPESGTLNFQKGLKVGFLEQVPQLLKEVSVLDTVLGDDPDWTLAAEAQTIISKLELDEDANVSTLSGGWKKRVALARELLKKPDLLLLDEPTNHLDLDSILMLEEMLAQARFASITITHDRAFLQKVSSRIIELDKRNPGGLLSIQGDYAHYLESKQLLMDAQEIQEVRLKNTLRRETEWLRRGPKARTTKQQARITRAGELMDTVQDLQTRNQNQTVDINFQSVGRSPKKLIVAENISKAYAKRIVVPKISLTVTPKTRLGILGVNGAGKSTLIQILLSHLKPDTGSVVASDQLQAVYFEQSRETLDPQLTVQKTVCPTGDSVYYKGQRIHVNGYLDRFLFKPEQFLMKVERLSGGEQSRLLIARLMLQPANVLILDEPTNDLDVATLDILQDVLQNFDGAVVLVSHDRYFLDQVCDQILAFCPTPAGGVDLVFFEGLDQWLAWKRESIQSKGKNTAISSAAAVETPAVKKKKLSFKDQHELENIEKTIRLAEANLAKLEMEKPSEKKSITQISVEMAKAHQEIERLYARWSELEKMSTLT